MAISMYKISVPPDCPYSKVHIPQRILISEDGSNPVFHVFLPVTERPWRAGSLFLNCHCLPGHGAGLWQSLSKFYLSEIEEWLEETGWDGYSCSGKQPVNMKEL